METIKTIKSPAYALKLGTGKFVGTDWQCKYCGMWAETPGGIFGGEPSPLKGDGCPGSYDGRHKWIRK